VTYDETQIAEVQVREMVKDCGFACGEPLTRYTAPGETVSHPREVDQAMIHPAMNHAAEVSVAAKALQ
jgi:hypothetical protein